MISKLFEDNCVSFRWASRSRIMQIIQKSRSYLAATVLDNEINYKIYFN